jgi:hypothetical protein|tara:strand:- start:329 stop:619 length:291 start_codon:yes stop_codon:yes gene_type:complete
MKWKDKYEAKIKRIIKQVTGLSDPDDGALIPAVIIKGSGHIWCYAPIKNKFLRIPRGTQGYIVDKKEDERGRILVYTVLADLLLVEADEISYTGYN